MSEIQRFTIRLAIGCICVLLPASIGISQESDANPKFTLRLPSVGEPPAPEASDIANQAETDSLEAEPASNDASVDDTADDTAGLAEEKKVPANNPRDLFAEGTGEDEQASKRLTIGEIQDNIKPRPTTFKNARVIHLDGPINGMRQAFVEREVERAKRAQVDLLVIEITSPGGELNASIELANLLDEIEWAHIIAYIPTEAISGGAIIALGCDEIIMRPRAEIGDAGPIQLGLDLQFRHAPEKIVSYLAANLRNLAESNGRPPAIAEAMADRNLEVLEVRNTKSKQIWYLSRDELKSLVDKGDWEEIGPVFEARPDHFLTTSGERAVELKLASTTVEDKQALWNELGVSPPVLEVKETWLDSTAYYLSSPFVTALLIIIGLVALYIEFTAPGIGAGGAVAFACFGLFFWSRILGGSASWLDVSLFVIGVVLLGMEFFVIPGFGVAGLGGITLILLSLVMSMQRFTIPQDAAEWSQLGTSLITILGAFTGFVLFVILLASYSQSIPIFGQLKLKPPTAEPFQAALFNGNSEGAETAAKLNIGDTGVSVSALRPSGKAMFGDRIVDVVSEGDFVDGDVTVKIMRISGNQVVVRVTS